MGYLDIDNLYKNQKVLMLKECYAMEKIHGTSAHITFKSGRIGYFAGGGNHETFVKLFNEEELVKKFEAMGLGDKSITVYGESYGGKMQGMSATYGKEPKFIVFDIHIGDSWLNIPKAESISKDLGLEFVHYKQVSTNLDDLNAERDADSVQAIRNGMGPGHMREGIVIRPLEELIDNRGERIIAKHKRDEFKETNTPRKVIDPEKLKVLSEAKAIAEEWVTPERLNHILTSGEIEAKMENTSKIIELMVNDVIKESKGEIFDSPNARRAIGKETALLLKKVLTNTIV